MGLEVPPASDLPFLRPQGNLHYLPPMLLLTLSLRENNWQWRQQKSPGLGPESLALYPIGGFEQGPFLALGKHP